MLTIECVCNGVRVGYSFHPVKHLLRSLDECNTGSDSNLLKWTRRERRVNITIHVLAVAIGL